MYHTPVTAFAGQPRAQEALPVTPSTYCPAIHGPYLSGRELADLQDRLNATLTSDAMTALRQMNRWPANKVLDWDRNGNRRTVASERVYWINALRQAGKLTDEALRLADGLH